MVMSEGPCLHICSSDLIKSNSINSHLRVSPVEKTSAALVHIFQVPPQCSFVKRAESSTGTSAYFMLTKFSTNKPLTSFLNT